MSGIQSIVWGVKFKNKWEEIMEVKKNKNKKTQALFEADKNSFRVVNYEKKWLKTRPGIFLSLKDKYKCFLPESQSDAKVFEEGNEIIKVMF